MSVLPLPAIGEATHPISHRYVTARGARFHVAESGPADGEPLMLLHGFGWPEAPRHGYSTGNLAEDVIAVLDELGIAKAAIAGHDWGGWVALAAAVRYPERVRSLASVNMTHLWPARARAAEQVHAAYVWREIFAHPLGRHRMARLTVPTPIIGGERDVVIPPAVLEGGERHADDLRVLVLSGGGHLLPEEQPAAVAEALVHFLG